MDTLRVRLGVTRGPTFLVSGTIPQAYLLFGGYYHIIYTDYYKSSNNSCDFQIFNVSSNSMILTQNLIAISNWTPLIINTVIRINSKHVIWFRLIGNNSVFKRIET